MTNDINFWTGIKDPYLKPDKPFLTEDKELKIIHLIQSYPMHCPLCGQLMRRNGFRKRPVTIKILTLAGKPAVLKIKKQQYLCPPSPQCPKRVTKVAEVQGVNFACRIANVVKYHIVQELSENESMRTIASHHNVLLTPLSVSSRASKIPLRLILTGYRQPSLLMTLNPVSLPKVG